MSIGLMPIEESYNSARPHGGSRPRTVLQRELNKHESHVSCAVSRL